MKYTVLIAAFIAVLTAVSGCNNATSQPFTPAPSTIAEQVRNHVTCYPFGIDEIGAGNEAGGIAIWRSCFASNYQFTYYPPPNFTPVTCPGTNCPFPATMDSVEMRAALAKGSFDAQGFIRTSHQLNNITILSATDTAATVKAYIQPWHLLQDGTSVLAVGTWQVSLANNGGGWLITKEDLQISFAGVLPAFQ